MERIAKKIMERMDRNEFAGAAMIVMQHGEIVYSERVGYADIERQTQITADTIFRMASMTKPVVAAAALILAEQGKLKLTDPIHRYLPEYANMKAAILPDGAQSYEEEMIDEQGTRYAVVPAAREIRIVDLLNHTSGLGMGMASQRQVVSAMQPDDSLQERVAKWSGAVLDFQPGSASGYSALLAFDIMGRIIEVVSGLDLQQFLIRHIFQPLQLTDTRFQLSDEQKRRTAALYHAEEGRLLDVTSNNDMALFFDGNRSGYFSGGAGLYSTASDYIQFVKMLAHGGECDGIRILKPESVLALRANQLPEHLAGGGSGTVWGLGVRVIVDEALANTSLTAGSFGWSGAFGTHFWIDPARNLAALLMMNLANIGGAGSVVAYEFEQSVYSAIDRVT